MRLVSSYLAFPPLPRQCRGGISLLHFSWSRLRRTLSVILPCAARTFLTDHLSVGLRGCLLYSLSHYTNILCKCKVLFLFHPFYPSLFSPENCFFRNDHPVGNPHPFLKLSKKHRNLRRSHRIFFTLNPQTSVHKCRICSILLSEFYEKRIPPL